MRSLRLHLAVASTAIALAAIGACSSSDEVSPVAGTTSATTAAVTTGAGGAGGQGGQGGSGGSAPDPSAICVEQGLPIRPFDDGVKGTHRGEIADDFTLTMLDGSSWSLQGAWSGCETYWFVPDRIPVSDLDDTSVWESDADLAKLVEKSPRNTHWFFVSRKTDDAEVTASLSGMQGRIDALLATMTPEDGAHWRSHVHVVGTKASDIEGWVGDVLVSHGRIGFGIDRRQKIRGAGYLADVKRYDQALANANAWPWKSNLAYAANEPLYDNAQAIVLDRLDAEDATVVQLFDGETLAEFADVDVTLPDAATMAGFDTLEIEIVQQCPDPEQIELGNCGAWDYIANLFVEGAPDTWTELARFITSYHRETHWVVDASAMLVHLKDGGARTFRWSFAPSWNTQPTATKLALRFSNQQKGMRPAEATFLWSGGPFDSNYNPAKLPVDVPIPAEAQKVELWAIVTGHGAGTHQCSEFCNHQHEFTVNGTIYKKQHPGAGSDDDGCVPQDEHGMTPNQAGTWWFGRGGWCPGQQVDPWVVDVTADVTPGQTATIEYRGLWGNQPPTDGSGDIVLTSYLVVYE